MSDTLDQVQQCSITSPSHSFPSLTGDVVFYRSYSRRDEENKYESWGQVVNRIIDGLKTLGELTFEEARLLWNYYYSIRTLPSGRWMWVGGTEWIEKPENYFGAFNCTGSNITDLQSMAMMMELAMQGSGTGYVLEEKYISQLPVIRSKIEIVRVTDIGSRWQEGLYPNTGVGFFSDSSIDLVVGDSRQGWVGAYLYLLKIATSDQLKDVQLRVDLSYVRPAGVKLKGFGGVSNPIKLPEMFPKIVRILNGAVGRKLTPKEICLLLNEAALVVVAGNVRRSASIAQFDASYPQLKLDLWKEVDGKWQIDPDKDALRMANHTRVYHHKPTEKECIEAVRLQYQCGEGAIQYAPEAITRANVDLLNTPEKKTRFIELYLSSPDLGHGYLQGLGNESDDTINHRMGRYSMNPCFAGHMSLLTVDGYRTFAELAETEVEIINASGSISKSKVWCSGVKETINLTLTNRQVISCTPDHRLMTFNGEMEAKDCKHQSLMPYLKKPERLEEKTILLGFIQGDGQLTRLSKPGFNAIEINIGRKDLDIVDLIENLGLPCKWHGDRRVYVHDLNYTLKALGFSSSSLPERVLPTTYPDWDLDQKAAFLNGLYSANGSVVNGRITLKTTCKELAQQVQESLLEDFSIESYITTNKSKPVQFENGVYQCRESYDLNIQQYTSRQAFFNLINFSIEYKTQKLANHLLESAPAVRGIKPGETIKVYDFTEPLTNWGVVEGFVVHNCGEIIGNTFTCNLSEVHLNQLDPFNFQEQEEAFKAAALSVAALLKRGFVEERYQKSRELDPIVGVSFTGLFDFFVHAFGVDWLKWWEAGRPDEWKVGRIEWFYSVGGVLITAWSKGDLFRKAEQEYLSRWSKIAHEAVWEYCDRHNLKRPNRCTTVQPAGSKSLLTGASPGWHPPKAARYIRRITCRKNDPVALAGLAYGYSVVPSQSDKDDEGNLLNDPFDPRCTEWLLEIPVEVSWANLPGADQIQIEKFSALAQIDFCMNVQKYYATHNVSSTWEIRESEIEEVGKKIYQLIQDDEGYISATVLARFDDSQTFPRLPFEPISKEVYDQLKKEVQERKTSDNYLERLNHYSQLEGQTLDPVGPAGCDSDKCLLSDMKPKS